MIFRSEGLPWSDRKLILNRCVQRFTGAMCDEVGGIIAHMERGIYLKNDVSFFFLRLGVLGDVVCHVPFCVGGEGLGG